MPEAAPARLNIADEFISRPAREYSSKIAVISSEGPEGGAEFSYADVEREVNRVAHALRASNCQPGDRVLIVLPDSIEFVASFFGTAKIGAIAVPVNSMARQSDYQHYLEDCGARFAIVHRDSYEAVATALARSSVECAVVVGSRQRIEPAIRDVTVRWEEWLPEWGAPVRTHATAPADPAFLLYTSGTGGPARAAVHGHKDMLVTSRGFAQGVLGLRADDRTFSVSKLFFAYGLGNAMYFPFSVGATTILYPARARADRIAELVARQRPTVFFSVPTFYGALLREAENGWRMDFSSLRLAVSAGEALPAEIFRRFRERFSIEILDGIGSTEMLHMYISCRPGATRAGSCGMPVPGYRARILDDQGGEVPEGTIGNLWIAGDSMFAEYWNQPELTARVRNGPWFSTGDKFIRDPDGFHCYCGRSDDMIKVSGMWVSPGEVENALLTHPAVTECAVVGHADAVGLVRPVAYIVLRSAIVAPGGLDSELNDWLHARLVGFKCPEEYRFVAALPKTATGKIQRFLLRQS
ncbi:MAG TPA: benzoate-CoA ligase family protein [Candidatus Cybelea sp.]|nr:benzoate-CoA ligase family protein [Candidatus Cybelea sp.]